MFLLVVLCAVLVGSVRAHDHDEAPFMWSGGVTTSEVHFRVKGHVNAVFGVTREDDGILLYSAVITDSLAAFNVTDLEAYTVYNYGLLAAASHDLTVGAPDAQYVLQSSVKTFPEEGTAVDLKIAFGSCVYDTTTSVFDAIGTHEPDILIVTGDLFYGDITANEEQVYNEWYSKSVGATSMSSLLSRIPAVYIWDDHDFGENDSNEDSNSATSAQTAYRRNVPHYELPGSVENPVGDVPVGAIYQAFTYGTVRVILTDLRSESGDGHLMSEEQNDWFFAELAQAANYSTVVWVTSVPWTGATDKRSVDAWDACPDKRTLISNYIRDQNITNLIAISGDAHMLAIDDGTNTDYSDGEAPGIAGFPVFQGGPLANTGSTKGGPYSHGCHAYLYFQNQQYGTVTLSADGCVTMEGWVDTDVTPVLSYSTCSQLVREGVSGGGRGVCDLEYFPAWVWALCFTSMTAFLVAFVLALAIPTEKYWMDFPIGRSKPLRVLFLLVLFFGSGGIPFLAEYFGHMILQAYGYLYFIALLCEAFLLLICIPLYRWHLTRRDGLNLATTGLSLRTAEAEIPLDDIGKAADDDFGNDADDQLEF